MPKDARSLLTLRMHRASLRLHAQHIAAAIYGHAPILADTLSRAAKFSVSLFAIPAKNSYIRVPDASYRFALFAGRCGISSKYVISHAIAGDYRDCIGRRMI